PAFLCVLSSPPHTEISTLSLHDALPIWIEPDQCAVDLRPHEAGGTELRGDFDIGTMRARRQWERDQHRLGLPPASRSHELVHHLDRKSTRLNSSHEWISYAVFCLKKKKK